MTRTPFVLTAVPLVFVGAVGLLFAIGLAGASVVAEHDSIVGVFLWMLPSVLVGTVFVGYGTIFLQRTVAGAAASLEWQLLSRYSRILIGVFSVFSITVSVAVWAYVRDLEVTTRQQRLDQQAAIANLKRSFAEKWVTERWLDISHFSRSMRSSLEALSNPTRDDLRFLEVLLAEFLSGSLEWVGVRLHAPDGGLLASAGETPEAGGAPPSSSPANSGASPAEAHIVQWRMPSGAMRLDFVLPVSRSPAPAALLVVTIDPEVALLPELVRWPVESASSEIAVLRREGSEAVYVTPPPRTPTGTSLPFAVPLTRTDIVGVQGVMDGDGVRVGLDYRDVRVLAATRVIATLGWSVVAKTDVAEALEPLERRERLVLWLTAMAIVVAAAATASLWFVARHAYAALGSAYERDRRALSRHYEEMIRVARDVVILMDESQTIVDANPAAVDTYGYTLDELRRMKGADLRPQRLRSAIAADWETMLATGGFIQTVHCRKDGSEFPVEVSLNEFTVNGRTFIQSFLRDISHRHLTWFDA